MRRGQRALALAAVLLLGAAAPPLPGLGGPDPRHGVDMHAAPWRSLALLTMPGIGRCTAFLVAPTIAVTAAHCLYSTRLGHFVPASAVHVLVGYDRGNFTAHSLVAQYHVAGAFDPARPAATRGADIAVLRLAASAASALALADAAGGAVVLGGYDQDRPEVILADTRCHILAGMRDGEGRMLLVHDCAATHGSSGAPLLARAADGSWRVVGVQVGGRNDGVGGVAVPIAAVRAEI